jgi:hypothetical protein
MGGLRREGGNLCGRVLVSRGENWLTGDSHARDSRRGPGPGKCSQSVFPYRPMRLIHSPSKWREVIRVRFPQEKHRKAMRPLSIVRDTRYCGGLEWNGITETTRESNPVIEITVRSIEVVSRK